MRVPSLAPDSPLFLQAIVAHVGEAVCVISLDNRLVFANPAFCNLYGYSEAEVAGTSIEGLVVSPNPASTLETVKVATEAGGWVGEMVNRRRDGSEFPVRLSTAPMRNEAGQIVAYIAIAQDVTELKRVEQAQQRQLDTLDTLNELAVGLATHSASGDLYGYITSSLKKLTGAVAAAMTEYRPRERNLVLRRLDGDSAILAAAKKVLGFDVKEIVSPLDETTCRQLITKRVAMCDSLSEVTFGAISPIVARVVQTVTRINRYVGIAYVVDGALYGTSVLAFRDGSTIPSTLLLEAISSLAAVALRRYQVEEDLRIANERYLALYDRSQVCVYVHDIDGRFVDANPAMLRLLGFRRDEVSGMTFSTLFSGAQLQRALAAKAQVIKDGYSKTPETFQLTARDGREVWLETESTVIRRDGEPHLVCGLARDITRQKEAEAALRDRERRYRDLIENAAVGIYQTSPDGRILAANKTLLRMLNFNSFEELMVRNLEEGGFEPGYTRAAFRQLVEQSGEIRGLESAWTRRDGTTLYVRENARVLRDGQGNALYYEGTVEDITGKKRADEERERLLSELLQAQKMESIGRLAGGVAHDFNNLLTVINGYSKMALDRTQPGDALRRLLTEVTEAGDRAAVLVQQLLAYGRKQVLRPQVLDLNDVLKGARGLLAPMLREDITLEIDYGPDLKPVRADRRQLEQVLLNLAANARDAMPLGGKLTITTANQPGLDSVRLSVTDSGVGMDEATRQRLFEPFFTTKDAGQGTGLGLSSVQGIVTQSGGTITVESEPGAGTVFHVILPAASEDGESGAAAADGHHTQRTKTGRTVPPVKGRTVVLVDDRADVWSEAVAALKAEGYRVLAAAGYEAALTICRAERVDLLVTDVAIAPDMAARVQRLQPGISTLIVSGCPGTTHEDKAGSVDHPCTPEKLASKVRDALELATSPWRILLVEPDDRIRQLLRMVLERAGYAVVESGSGRQALAAIEEAVPDALVVNQLSAGPDTVDILERLRRERPSLKVVASGGPGAGVDVTKPVMIQALLATLEGALAPKP